MKVKSLNEISNPKQWKNLPISKLKNSGFPVYGANGIIGFFDEYNHANPTIAITCRGATCGNIHITRENSYITSNAMALDDLDENECKINYLAQYLRYRGLSDVTTGAAQPQITRANLEKVKIPLPPLDDQIRIAHLLGKVEGLIAQRKQHLQQLDDLLKSVFLEMFGDHTTMRRQQHFPFGEFIEFLTSGSRGWAQYYSDSGSIFLRINNVKDARLKLEDIVYVNAPDSAEANRTRVRAGDLLLSITADLGRTAVVPNALDGSYINQHLALIRINIDTGFNPSFLAWYFSLPYGNSFIQKKNREGVKAGLNFDDIRSFPVIKPPIDLQNQFAAIVEKVESLKSRYQQSLTDLKVLYGALSQKAFKGELDLSRVPLV